MGCINSLNNNGQVKIKQKANIFLIGDSKTGKTSLLKKYMELDDSYNDAKLFMNELAVANKFDRITSTRYIFW